MFDDVDFSNPISKSAFESFQVGLEDGLCKQDIIDLEDKLGCNIITDEISLEMFTEGKTTVGITDIKKTLSGLDNGFKSMVKKYTDKEVINLTHIAVKNLNHIQSYVRNEEISSITIQEYKEAISNIGGYEEGEYYSALNNDIHYFLRDYVLENIPGKDGALISYVKENPIRDTEPFAILATLAKGDITSFIRNGLTMDVVSVDNVLDILDNKNDVIGKIEAVKKDLTSRLTYIQSEGSISLGVDDWNYGERSNDRDKYLDRDIQELGKKLDSFTDFIDNSSDIKVIAIIYKLLTNFKKEIESNIE
jgi:hypothetical protein